MIVFPLFLPWLLNSEIWMVITPISKIYNFCWCNINPFSLVCKWLISCKNTTYIFMDMPVIGKVLTMIFMLMVVLPSLSMILSICKRLHFRPPFQWKLPKVITTHHFFIVCSLYLSSGQPLSATNLFDLFYELPTPFIVIGNFNAHNSMWGSRQICQRGAIREQLLLAHNLVLSNTDEPTDICMATDSTSSIGLTLCGRSIAPHFDSTVPSDLHGSDLF